MRERGALLFDTDYIIERALVRRNVPDYLTQIFRSYLSDRRFLYGDNDDKKVTCGVPQGSVLGLLLWNIMYDNLLSLKLEESKEDFGSLYLVAFADNVAMMATGHNTMLLEGAMNRALSVVVKWIRENGLSLAVHKTEAVILTH